MPVSSALTAFSRANPDWPNLGALNKRAEDALPPSLDGSEVIAWFDKHKPQNPDSMVLYYEALMHAGRDGDATRDVRDLWINGTFTTGQLVDYRKRYAQIITSEDDAARADRLVWDKSYLDARAMLPMLNANDGAAIMARIALMTHAKGAESQEIPADRSSDPGVLYARAQYAMYDLNDQDAATILADTSGDAPHPAAWSSMRLLLARRLLESHNYQQAYDVAAHDPAKEPAQIAESQFLAGWIALRFLHDPDAAATHFVHMYDHVESPASRARAAYWAAQTKIVHGGVTSEQWLQRAAAHSTIFYGQLAAEELGRNLILPAEPRPTPAEIAHFERGDLPRAARMLAQAGDTTRVGQFITRMGEVAKEPTQAAMVVRFARDVGSIPASVQVAKKMLQNNVAVIASGYPLLNNVHVREPEPALVHSIIRQESLFNPVIVSPAGAIGLMQLMPATAAATARKAGVKETISALSQNPALNVTLGSAYLASMIEHYNGSYTMAIAAYNGGPGRVNEWVQDIGDPRGGEVDPVDWIEQIPVQETRNYVQRVLENLQVYRARLNGGAAPIQLLEDLRR